jgi:hypothetical protein
MSGYLSRIVHTAAGSEHRLHPLAGSVYSAPAAEPAAAPAATPQFTAAETGPVDKPLSAPVAPPSILDNYQPLQPHRPDSARLESPLAHSTARPHADGPAIAQRSGQPAQSHAVDDQATNFTPANRNPAQRVADKSDKDAPQSAPIAAQSEPVAANNPNHSSESANSEKTAAQHTRNPAQILTPQAVSPVRPARKHEVPSLNALPQQQPRREQRIQTPQQPDIQIHIGRIEVLAVQPPAPPAPAPRRDRTTSLADYLSGQSGRRS